MEFTKSSKNVIKQAVKAAKKLGHEYVGSEHLLLGLIREKESLGGFILLSNGVEEKRIVKLMSKMMNDSGDTMTKEVMFSRSYEDILAESEYRAKEMGASEIGTEHILLSLIYHSDCVAYKLLAAIGINFENIVADIANASRLDYRNVKPQGKKGKKKGKSETPALDHYGRDLTKMAKEGRLDPVIGRTAEMQRVIQILSRRMKNNPCLTGEPGVGKTAIIEGLAELIVAGDVPDSIAGKRIVTLDLAGMVAGSKYRGEFEERIKRVIDEVRSDKSIILFVDEVHTLIGAGGAEGSMDASNILKPALSRGEVQMIGATTTAEYRKYIEKDAALERRFQPVDVEEPTKEEAKEILMGLKHCYEDHHGIEITEEAVKAAVELSVRYINDRYLPDKAIDLIDEASSRKRLNFYSIDKPKTKAQLSLKAIDDEIEALIISGDIEKARQKRKERDDLLDSVATNEGKKKRKEQKKLSLLESDVAEVVSMWTKIPVSRLEEKESKRLIKLDKELHKRVIGQDEAVEAVAKAVKRGRVGLKDPKRPIGSFLFLGPTGVGKTELSKALSEAVFGDEKSMIRVDMSEYMEKHSVSKMIGSPPGYVGFDEGGQLSEKVRKHPYSVILFDEIEKAHPDVFNLLLQVLDDGHITDSHGRKVNFKDTIIIMTSNAGAQSIIEPKRLGFNAIENADADHKKMKEGVMEEVKRIFKPEFLNRIDETIVFRALSEKEIKEIIDLLMKELTERVLKQMNISLRYGEPVRQFIFKKGYDKKYGARPLKRAIQTHVEDMLAEEVLAGHIIEGDKVALSVKDDKIIFTSDRSKNNTKSSRKKTADKV
ncbi:MAG: ATP-dependent Clp protease ATP-binding subunit [Lachnospiraceae bacterium]|nr:ATP-dependent Clp protease ATP-binding subunit [Lachnospiraceae bacterium]